MVRRSKPRKKNSAADGRNRQRASELRIIGGELRGRKLLYSGRPEMRPMKDRVREAAFNLVGPEVRGMHALDLFAGTGALGLEALSRGAASATLIEIHLPTARVIRENVARLGLESRAQVVMASAFDWARRTVDLPEIPWVVFCSPPYDFYVERLDQMLDLVGRLREKAPRGSMLVVEADHRFNYEQLPLAERWNVRRYPPAVVGILRDREE